PIPSRGRSSCTRSASPPAPSRSTSIGCIPTKDRRSWFRAAMSPCLKQAVSRMIALQSRRRLEILAEKAIEVLIRLCGVSAILFVFGIFFFVFREGSHFLFHGFKFGEFFFSQEWYPTSESHVRYGALALIAGTASV